MAEAAAHLVDNVFPEAPVRQWVLSFPWKLRYLLALDPRLCRAVRTIFLRAVFGFYSRKARDDGIEGGRTGCVNQVQRFGSALNANLHFHALLLDGVYTAPDPFTAPSFHCATRITDAEVAKLLFAIRSRVLRLCRRRGLMGEEQEIDARGEEMEQGLLPLLQAASIQGRVALGPEAGSRVSRLGSPPVPGSKKAVVIKELCADLDGFTLHAAVRVESKEGSRLEHLCRYVTRPPLSTERLSLDEQGRVVQELRVPFRDGTTHFVFDPLVFIERLAALVPPARMHQLTYHGVLAPAASWRSEIVPRRVQERRGSGSKSSVGPCSRYTWPELMRRVFSVDVLKCAKCGSRRRWIAAITSPEVIVRVLEYLGLASVMPTPAPARASPQGELVFS
jgi:hypothetical protein